MLGMAMAVGVGASLSVNHHIELKPSADGKDKYGSLYAGEGKLYVHDAQGEDQDPVSAYTLK